MVTVMITVMVTFTVVSVVSHASKHDMITGVLPPVAKRSNHVAVASDLFKLTIKVCFEFENPQRHLTYE